MTKSSVSANSKRIAKNTLVLYFRMIFLMLVSLYTSRVILEALGVTDYGIYNVVGGFVSMFALISAALTSACSRFLNYEMGKGDIERQKVVFSTALTIQWGLAITVAVLAEAIGVWYVNNVMVLPPDRLEAANWCFQFSVFNFCMNLITVPYNASIVAHERMKAFAYVSIYQGLAILAISFLVSWSPIDRLIFYAFMLLVVQFSVRYAYQVYCRIHFDECHYIKVFDKPLLKHMFSYSVWHLVGNGASVLKGHGVNLVLNFFFGPAVNAARGIATQVDAAINQFVSNFMMAINPQITQSYARENFQYMFKLINTGSCMCYYLFFILSLPIIINTDYILHIWLKEVPEYCVGFVRLTLISMIIGSISMPLITAQNATGHVRNYQLVVGGIKLLNLPVSYVALLIGMPPTSVVIVSIIVEILALIARVYMLPYTLKNFVRKKYVYEVIVKVTFISAVSIPIPVICYFLLPENTCTFLLNSIVSLTVTSLVVFFIGIGKEERNIVRSQIVKVKQKIR